MLFGVSGNCDDREVTSLPEEFPKDPDSEKDTWQRRRRENISDIRFTLLLFSFLPASLCMLVPNSSQLFSCQHVYDQSHAVMSRHLQMDEETISPHLSLCFQSYEPIYEKHRTKYQFISLVNSKKPNLRVQGIHAGACYENV